MVLKIIEAILLAIIALHHAFVFKKEKAEDIANGVSFICLIALAFLIGA